MTMRYCWRSEKSMEDAIASLQQQGISYDKQRNQVMVEDWRVEKILFLWQIGKAERSCAIARCFSPESSCQSNCIHSIHWVSGVIAC